jgi:hypothetical protein
VADGRLRQLFWRVADDLDYLVTLVRLRMLDALADPSRKHRPIRSAIGNGYGGRSPRSSRKELGAPTRRSLREASPLTRGQNLTVGT